MGLDLPTDREHHTTTLKVRFYELDPYDHVNHTNYFGYFETARIEYLSELGWGMDVLKEMGVQIVVAEIQARFMAAARFAEQLTIYTWVDVGRVRSVFDQVMTRHEDEEVARLSVTGVFTDLDGRPRRVPEEFLAFSETLKH